MRYRTCQLLGTFILFLALILLLPISGQYREYYFYGKVLDTQKNPLEGVEITLRDVETSRSYAIKTNKKGEFKLVGLPHGVYKAVFKKEGYAVKEDEWRFETPQDTMLKAEIPDVVLVPLALVREQERLKEMQGALKEASEKIGQRDFDAAISLLKSILEKNPEDPNALYLIGISYSRKKMLPEAIDVLTQVTQLSPKFAPAYFELGVCYEQQGDQAKALEYFQKTMELDTANPDAAYNSGLILFGQNRMDEALTLFEKALELRPDDPAYLEMTGRCSINKGNFERAVELLEKAKAGYEDPEKIKFLDDLIAKLKEQIKK
jgi:tetratricopeptide (TPR) repeat protein